MDELAHEEISELDFVDDEIATLQTTYLRQRADELLIPELDFDPKGPNWIEARTRSGWQLSLEARATLRNRIHVEETRIWEHRTRWIILLIGLIGATTGLASVLKH